MPKSFGYLRKARPPINTYKDFFSSEPSHPKRSFNEKKQEIKRASAEEPTAMRRHKDSYVVIKLSHPKRRFNDRKSGEINVPEYRQHELKEFVKKRHFNRWTSNPRPQKKEPIETHVKLTNEPTKQLTQEQRRLK